MKTLRLIGLGLLAVILCFSFSSCKDDDEGGVGGSNPFVGVWDSGRSTHEYKSDGTFIFNIVYSDNWKERRTGRYSYNSSTKELVYIYDSNGLGSSYYLVKHISENEIVYVEVKDGYVYTLKRKK